MLEIVSSKSCSYSMKKSKLNKDNILELELLLSISDLSKINNFEIDFPNNIFNKSHSINFKDKINRIKKENDIRIWASHKDTNSYLTLLYLCSLFKDTKKNIFVIFTDEFNENFYSPSCMLENELEASIVVSKLLTSNDIDLYSSEWNEILNNNSDFRIMINNKCEAVNYNYFDSEILNSLKDYGEIKKSYLVLDFMKKYYISDLLGSYLIDRLIYENKIIITKKSDRSFDDIIKLNN